MLLRICAGDDSRLLLIRIVALGRDDEVSGEVLAADVVEIAGNAKRREGLCPGAGLKGFGLGCERQDEKESDEEGGTTELREQC